MEVMVLPLFSGPIIGRAWRGSKLGHVTIISLLTTLLVVASPAVPGEAAVRSTPVYLRPCDQRLYRPTDVQLACGDGNFGLERLRWRSWNGPVARGFGVAYYNDCLPACADGHFHRYRAAVTLNHRRRCPGALQYLRIDIRGTRRHGPRTRTSLHCDGTYDPKA